MSRIHEALKRAEQERAVCRGISEPAATIKDSLATLAPEGTTQVLGPVLTPSFTTQFSLDALLTRTIQGKWSPDKKAMLFFNPETVAGTEQFRTLRSKLQQMREKQPLKKVLVTSALPKEGKSFVAANLAQVMVQQHGRRALLIDADLRGARLHLALGTSATPGLSEYLQGEAEELAIVQRGPMENLFFIPSGRISPNPAELIANHRLKFLLSRMEPIFDWIIIDSPPVAPVSDASLMANCCDGVLMVVRSNSTPSDVARKARAEFENRNLLGVVLNGIEGPVAYSDYYYNDYGRQEEKPGLRDSA
jgi:protein-tyrosine kinase